MRKTPPILTPDSTGNRLTADDVITFAEDKSWRSAAIIRQHTPSPYTNSGAASKGNLTRPEPPITPSHPTEEPSPHGGPSAHLDDEYEPGEFMLAYPVFLQDLTPEKFAARATEYMAKKVNPEKMSVKQREKIANRNRKNAARRPWSDAEDGMLITGVFPPLRTLRACQMRKVILKRRGIRVPKISRAEFARQTKAKNE